MASGCPLNIKLMNQPNKLEMLHNIGLSNIKHLNTLTYWSNLSVTKKIKCCEYGPRGCIHNTPFSSKLINVNKKLVLYCTRLKRPPRIKHFSLSGKFVNYKEKSVVNISPGTVFTTHYFLILVNDPNCLSLSGFSTLV
jgi:hypothetical protein